MGLIYIIIIIIIINKHFYFFVFYAQKAFRFTYKEFNYNSIFNRNEATPHSCDDDALLR